MINNEKIKRGDKIWITVNHNAFYYGGLTNKDFVIYDRIKDNLLFYVSGNFDNKEYKFINIGSIKK